MATRGNERTHALLTQPRTRRALLLGAAAALGSSLLAACGGTAATTAPATTAPAPAPTTAAAAATVANPAATTGAAAATTGAAGATMGAANATTGAAAATTGTSATTAPAMANPMAGAVTVGSNYSDAVPKAAIQAVFDGFTKKTGIPVTVNTVEHNAFQEQINNYLQGKPDDVFTWFAGYRMQFFAAQGLASPIDDVWQKIGPTFSDAFKSASTGADKKMYFVPIYNYPWAVFYRKSLFMAKGYTVPTTLDQLKTLADQMKKDGLTPFAFADKDGWPAMGTFDILNMRTNGYDFHVSLMSGKESWQDPKVKAVFDTWRGLLPYHQDGALGRTWQDAAQSLVSKQSAMFTLGSFVSQQFTVKADQDDLDFFPFPAVNPMYAQDSLDAPIDGFMLSKAPKNPTGAKQLLMYLGSGEAQDIYQKGDPSNIAAAKDASTAGYTPLQKKSADLIGGAKHIAQFLDRDTRPDFASTVMIPSLQKFINAPNDVDTLLKSIEDQKKSIFVG